MANGRKASKVATTTASGRKQWPAEESEGGGGAGASTEDLVTIVRGLAAAVAEHNLSELVVDTPEVTFTLRRGVAGVATAVAVPQLAPMHAPVMPPMPVAIAAGTPSAPPPPSHASALASAAPAYEAAVEDKGHVVTSPFVGTFYRKPNPDSPGVPQ